MTTNIAIGVLALQGAVDEHLSLLKKAVTQMKTSVTVAWTFLEVRTPQELAKCDALIIPGGESTTVSLVAARSHLLEPLREFVKVHRKPTWGTCAGLILLAESADRTKKGGQDLIGGLDVRVTRNHFGRQTESFEAPLDMPFLVSDHKEAAAEPFRGVFIRAPVVAELLSAEGQDKVDDVMDKGTVFAPTIDFSRRSIRKPVKILARLPGRTKRLVEDAAVPDRSQGTGNIVAVMQENIFGTSFHPELTQDARIHVWWLQSVTQAIINAQDQS